jgi:cytochrome P450
VGVEIPQNVRISTYPYLLHRDATEFTEPTKWRPERWMCGEPVPQTDLWAFGKGARSCLGSHLAVQRKCYVVASFA